MRRIALWRVRLIVLACMEFFGIDVHFAVTGINFITPL